MPDLVIYMCFVLLENYVVHLIITYKTINVVNSNWIFNKQDNKSLNVDLKTRIVSGLPYDIIIGLQALKQYNIITVIIIYNITV